MRWLPGIDSYDANSIPSWTCFFVCGFRKFIILIHTTDIVVSIEFVECFMHERKYLSKLGRSTQTYIMNLSILWYQTWRLCLTNGFICVRRTILGWICNGNCNQSDYAQNRFHCISLSNQNEEKTKMKLWKSHDNFHHHKFIARSTVLRNSNERRTVQIKLWLILHSTQSTHQINFELHNLYDDFTFMNNGIKKRNEL